MSFLSIKGNGSHFCLILCKTLFVSKSTPRAHFWNMLIKWHIRTETQLSTSIAWSRSSVSSHHILNDDFMYLGICNKDLSDLQCNLKDMQFMQNKTIGHGPLHNDEF